MRKRLTSPRRIAAAVERLECRRLLTAYTVNATSDTGAGSGFSGDLRYCINQANANAGANSISFDAFLFSSPRTIQVTSTLPDITHGVTITGPGTSFANVRGEGLANAHGIFRIAIGASGVSISNLTISNAVGSGAGGLGGGGVFNQGSTTLTNVIFSDNVGGAVANHQFGTLSVTNCTFQNNMDTALLTIDGVNFAGPMTVTGCTFINNTRTAYGGAIVGSSESQVTISNSTFLRNRANDGGGAVDCKTGPMTIEGCYFSDNVTGLGGSSAFGTTGGGAIRNSGGYLLLNNSTITNNRSDLGGGLFALYQTQVNNSTFSNNFAKTGGGIYNQGFNQFVLAPAGMSMNNCTISGNSAINGGGIANTQTLVLTNCTITNNSASSNAAGMIVVFDSANNLNGNTVANNTFIAGNYLSGNGQPNNVVIAPGASFSGSFNYISDTDFAALKLGPLADNGGPTMTHALLPGNVAINAGSNALAPAGLTTDQRSTGFARVRGGTVDIGAVEDNSVLVTTLNDEDNGSTNPALGAGTSLREAINFANTNAGEDSIVFAAALFTGGTLQNIDLTSALPILTDHLSIRGPGANLLNLRRSSGGNYGILRVSSISALRLFGLTISNGNTNEGGGVVSPGGVLNITGCVFTGNTAGFGGAINAGGTITISDSTISGNSAQATGGGIHCQGALTIIRSTISGNTLTNTNSSGAGIFLTGVKSLIINSTISGNSAPGSGGKGGGILVQVANTLSLTHCTITLNSAGQTGGGVSGGVIANNTIISGNLTNGQPINVDQTPAGSGNLINGNALLGPLADNGGPTKTHVLLAHSPAVNAGNSLLSVDGYGYPLATDQRGSLRSAAGAVDIGAYEYIPTESLIVTTTTDEDNGTSDPTLGAGTSLREALTYANSNPGADTVTFNLGAGVYTIQLSDSIFVSDGTTLAGPGAAKLALRGLKAIGANFSILQTTNGGTISGLTFTNGGGSSITQIGGAIRNFSGVCVVTDCIFSDNLANQGGAIATSGGDLTVKNCTLINNVAGGGGGGIINTAALDAGSLTVINCTFVGNSNGVENYGLASITNSTFFGNVTYGILNWRKITINNTIAANSGTQDILQANFFSDRTIAGSNNLIKDGNIPVGLTSTLTGDPGLLALSDNGGPTPTMLPATGSPVINAGSNSLVPLGLATDQRGSGYGRVSGVNVDIGAVERDLAAVTVTPTFTYVTGPQTLRFSFSANVSASFPQQALQLRNLTTSTDISPSNFLYQYITLAGQNTAQFSVSGLPGGVLPDGNYRVTLPNSIQDTNGHHLAGYFTFDFFVLAGDANRDRKVDANDLAILSANWQGASRTFAQGDFNYDTKVDIQDLYILASKWQQTLPPPALPAALPTAPASTTPVRRTPTRVASSVLS